MIASFLRVFFKPPVLWVHPLAGPREGWAYKPNGLEYWGQSIMTWVKFGTEFAVYASPFYMPFFQQRLFNTIRQHPRSLVDLALGLASLYVLGLVLRACGRVGNPAYLEFVQIFMRASQHLDREAKTALMRYDIDFTAWPVQFQAAQVRSALKIAAPAASDVFAGLYYLPHRLLGWLLINSFGLKLIYPGSTRWFLQPMVGSALTQQRGILVGKQGGERFKLRTSDQNDIDSIFIDRRALAGNGQDLVIVCEGNAGFYEIGMMSTALEAGYSILGWNHPGFWGSTGSPLPSQTLNAAETTFQFALNHLDFKPENIIVFGWSIGGFPASWLAKTYPNVKAVMLDATFDHIIPLAVPKMPAMAETIVRVGIEHFVNLDVASQAEQYDGPIKLIRRSKDEMIATDDSQPNRTNRINDLLLRILETRYPQLMSPQASKDVLFEYLALDTFVPGQRPPIEAVDDSELQVSSFPSKLGHGLPQATKNKLILALVSRYMIDVNSTHCIPLTVEQFALPWNPVSPGDSSRSKL